MVLFPLPLDAACTSLIAHFASKSAVLVLVWCYKATGDKEQDLWRYCLPECCIKQWCDMPTGNGYRSKKSGPWEQWGSDIAVSCNLATHPNIQSENTVFKTLWFSPQTRHSINTADNSLLLLLCLSSLSILSSCPVLNKCFCNQGMKLSWTGPMEYHPHTGVSLLLTSYLSVSWLWQF